MMKKKQSSLWRISCISATLPIVFLSLNVYAEPNNIVAKQINQESEAIVSSVSNEVTDQLPAILKTETEKNVDDKKQAVVKVSDQTLSYAVIIIDGKVSTKEDMYKLSSDEINSATIVKDKQTLKLLSVKFGKKNMSVLVEITTKDFINNLKKDKEDFETVPEVLPQFPGGVKAMMEFLKKEIAYPVVADKHGIQGRVIISFTVNEDGSISDVSCVRSSTQKSKAPASNKSESIDPNAQKDTEVSDEVETAAREAMEKEAIRVISNMPKWQPAKKDGKVVSTKFAVPVSFRI